MATLNLKDVPDDLRNHFKAVCALQGKTIRDVIMELMQKEVERAGRKK